MRNTSRKTYTGFVKSQSGEKTITVQVETYKSDKLYGKRFKYSKKFLVHDEKSAAKIGDKVLIMETRPLSKRKYFRLVEIKGRAGE